MRSGINLIQIRVFYFHFNEAIAILSVDLFHGYAHKTLRWDNTFRWDM